MKTFEIYSKFSIHNNIIYTIEAIDEEDCIRKLVSHGFNPKELVIKEK